VFQLVVFTLCLILTLSWVTNRRFIFNYFEFNHVPNFLKRYRLFPWSRDDEMVVITVQFWHHLDWFSFFCLMQYERQTEELWTNLELFGLITFDIESEFIVSVPGLFFFLSNIYIIWLINKALKVSWPQSLSQSCKFTI